MTMANGYFKNGSTNSRAAFDVFYRRNPDQGGFAIFAGLEQIIEYVENLHFNDDDIEYFRQQGIFAEDFLNYLKDKDTQWYETPSNVIAVPLDAVTGTEAKDKAHVFIYYFVKGSEPNYNKEQYVMESNEDN